MLLIPMKYFVLKISSFSLNYKCHFQITYKKLKPDPKIFLFAFFKHH